MLDSRESPLLKASSASGLFKAQVVAFEHAAVEGVRRVLQAAEVSAHVAHRFLSGRVRVTRNVPYLGSGKRAHKLDIYQPLEDTIDRLKPVVMYVHGGGFEVCSKDTHWIMAQSYAHAGFVVFNINYRLAPKHSFPRPLEDVCAAYLWVLDNARRFGGDPNRIVVAGESAGANLVSSLALINAIERPEGFARAVFKRNAPPSAVVAACGLFEVEQPERFRTLAKNSWTISKRTIEQVSRAYLPHPKRHETEHDLASPLRVLEGKHRLHRPLAPFFVPCGTNDPLLSDSQRLASSLRTRGVKHQARYYHGEIHAFHAMWWREASKECWRDTLDFVKKQFETQKRIRRVAA